MHITPANQMQVNGSAKPIYRTREDFLDFLVEKKIESNERKLKKASKELENLKQGIFKEGFTIEEMKQINQTQEAIIRNL
jgi:hypothetical protein